MGVLISTLNIFLPFTNPQTPLLQDLIHTLILCGTLYYAPQIAEYYKQRNVSSSIRTGDGGATLQAGNMDEDVPFAELDVGENREEAFEPPAGLQQARAPPPPAPHIQDEDQVWPDENDFAAVEAEAEARAAGQANERPRPTPANRTVGTKKAKSLARKDQRRAYHEFHRSQAEQRRLAEEAGREEREKALAEKKTRRADEERRIAERLRGERERRKEEERREAEDERERRERTVWKVREEMERVGFVNLSKLAMQEDKNIIWIERLVRASGVLEKFGKENEGSKAFITDEGWLVSINDELMKSAYVDAVRYGNESAGKVSFAQFGQILQKAVLARAKGVA